jgi:hypothetical protein
MHTNANEYRNFTKHLSKKHLDEKKDIILLGDVALSSIKADFFNIDEYQERINQINENHSHHIDDQVFEQEMELDDDVDENYAYKMLMNKNNFMENYMRLYLKYKDKYLIAAYKCADIFEDINALIKINNSNIIDLIKSCKKKYIGNDSAILDIVYNHLSKELTLFEETHSEAKYESTKENWKKDTGFYVEPIQIELEKNNTIQYVPIIDTIKAIFKNQQLADIYFNSINNKQQS